MVLTSNYLIKVAPDSTVDNSAYDFMKRGVGKILEVEATLGGTGAQVVNVFKIIGSVIILDQYAEITDATTLTNCTNVYSTLYDGTNTVNLTVDGATLSGAPVGTLFTKNLAAANTYSVSMADECRMSEVTNTKKVGFPFIVTAKNGANTYIRFHYTTTDNPINFTMKVWFEYLEINGGSLSLV